MGNTASETMLQVVSIAKERAAHAEREYDMRAAMLQRNASRSIDLFGGTAVSQVADIAAESRKICDSLYASYQMLVQMVDEQCRPLLEQQPDYTAVREVCNLIGWLNDESEIENNFTASLNSRDLGGVASGRYFPSIENKMIQSFWETKRSMWPGRAEAEALEWQKWLDEEEQERQEMKARRLNDLAAYEKVYAEWKPKADAIKKCRDEQLEKALSEAKEARLSEIETNYTEAVQRASEEKATCEKKKSETEATLASLGVFKFSEKKAAKKLIEELSIQITNATARLEAAEKTYCAEKSKFDSWMKKTKKQLSNKINEAYPMPPEPEKSEALKLIEDMVPGRKYTIAEMVNTLPSLEGLGRMEVSTMCRRALGVYIERTEDGQSAYFSVPE